MVTFDEKFYTEWVAHCHDDELIQEYIALQAFSCVPFFPESSLSDIVLNMQDILFGRNCKPLYFCIWFYCFK